MLAYFPSWQGAGNKDDIYAGSKKLKERLSKNYSFIEIEGFTPDSSDTQNGIQNYDIILKNLSHLKSKLGNNKPSKLFTLGGDCGMEVVPVSYLYNKYEGNLTVVWIDAHADINTPESSPSKTFHGMPVRVLLGEGDQKLINMVEKKLKPTDIVFVALRDADPAEETYIKSNNIEVITVEEINAKEFDMMNKFGELLKDHIYIHIDLDALDPNEFPGIMCPTPGGLTKSTLRSLIKELAGLKNIVGGSIVEYTGNQKEELDYVEEIFKLLNPA